MNRCRPYTARKRDVRATKLFLSDAVHGKSPGPPDNFQIR